MRVDPAQFFTASRVVIVAGKGGVGKTTVTAAWARAVSMAGLSSLVVEVEGKSALATAFGQPPLSYQEVTLHVGGGPKPEGEVRARTLTPDEALLEYLRDHGMQRISKRLVGSGALDVVSTAAPGIKDILILGKVKQLERSAGVDVLILDAPAAGHAVTFLRSPRGLLDAVRVGPIHTQAREVLDLLNDTERCEVVLVTLPEETPVNELIETAYSLEDEVGVALGPVVVNGIYSDLGDLSIDPAAAADAAGAFLQPGEGAALAAAARFRTSRMALQREQVDRLSEALPLPQLRLPFMFSSEIGPDQIDLLAAAMVAEVERLPSRIGERHRGEAT
jgi:anion-transporting  ArsA/GET3 family ATPase